MSMPPFSVGESGPGEEPDLLLEEHRHDLKVREAIRRNLADMVADEKIVVTDGRRAIHVPIPQYQEFRIRYDVHQSDHVGHVPGSGSEKEDDASRGGAMTGTAKEGGDGPGMDVKEAMITLEDVADVVFSDLALPDLDPLKEAPGTGQLFDPVTVARTGLKNHWAKKATLLANLSRRRRGGGAGYGPLSAEDLRFRVFQPVTEEQGGAVVLAMMDTSGSMGTFEKYLAKSFFFWTVEFLRRNYPRVELVFLAHDVRAREVDEDTFFHRGASGGTVSSSVYRLGRDILTTRFPGDRYNAYAFHFTDGGNLTSDNGLAVESGRELAGMVKLFGYGEIHDTERNPSPLYQEFSQVPGMGVMVLRSKEDIFRALYRFFGPSEEVRHAHGL